MTDVIALQGQTQGEGLYETLWSDGATLYYGEKAYDTARTAYEIIQQSKRLMEVSGNSSAMTVDVMKEEVTREEVMKEEGDGGAESKKRKYDDTIVVNGHEDDVRVDVLVDVGMTGDSEGERVDLKRPKIECEEQQEGRGEGRGGVAEVAEVEGGGHGEDQVHGEGQGVGGGVVEDSVEGQGGGQGGGQDGEEEDGQGEGDDEEEEAEGEAEGEGEGEGARGASTPRQSMLVRSKYSVPVETVLKWR